jgi:dihydroxyacetone kinase DhaKLM complex PTS-EIIA-like component DhaM
MADRGPVKIRQGEIDDLIALYKRSYQNVIQELIDATDAGKIQRARVLARINSELESLGVDVDKWVRREIPQYYLDGANQALEDLRKLGVTVTKAPINKEAIAALTDEVSLAFAESIKTIGRGAARVLTNAQKQQINMTIAEGKLTGDSRRMISAAVEKDLTDNGIGVLIDKGGRQWAFDSYSEMLVRTKAVEARNQGLANRMLQNGYDLVQVTDHNSEHPACERWEGKILSITGNTAAGTELPGGIEVAGSVQDAIDDGIFHPNCEHAINAIDPALAAKTEAYDNPFNQ